MSLTTKEQKTTSTQRNNNQQLSYRSAPTTATRAKRVLVFTTMVFTCLGVLMFAATDVKEGIAANAGTRAVIKPEVKDRPADLQQEAESQSMFLPIVEAVGSNAFCRFGVNLNTLGNGAAKDMNNYDVESLNIGWYINYSAEDTYNSSTVEHAPMIRVSQPTTDTYTYFPSAERIELLASRKPGADWFISNEPDRIQYQDSVHPHIYAEAYHELYFLIKDVDPTAQIFAGSIVQPTEVRLQYLDIILESYEEKYGEAMPVDGWSIHNFILNEASCDHYNQNVSICWGADIPPSIDAHDGMRIGIEQHHDIELFKAQIMRFRNWMNDSGYGGKPVYLSEYGVLLPDWYQPTVSFSAEAINEFMSESFDYILNTTDERLGDPRDGNRIIQRLSWYSVNDDYEAGPPYIYNGNLFKPTTFQRSKMGDNYADYTSELLPEVDIYPLSVSATVTDTDSLDEKEVTLTAEIANSGNLVESAITYVSFFNGHPDQGGEQIGKAQRVQIAGCGDATTVEVVWQNAPTGAYDIFVQTDREAILTETDEENNLIRTKISVSEGTSITP